MAGTIAFASCKEQWKKGGDGIEYKVIKEGKGDTIKTGQYLEILVTSAWNNGKKDSVLNADEGTIPVIVPLDSTKVGASYFKIFKQLKKGDSLVTRIISDSAYKTAPERMRRQ